MSIGKSITRMEARARVPGQRPLQNRHERMRPGLQLADPPHPGSFGESTAGQAGRWAGGSLSGDASSAEPAVEDHRARAPRSTRPALARGAELSDLDLVDEVLEVLGKVHDDRVCPQADLPTTAPPPPRSDDRRRATNEVRHGRRGVQLRSNGSVSFLFVTPGGLLSREHLTRLGERGRPLGLRGPPGANRCGSFATKKWSPRTSLPRASVTGTPFGSIPLIPSIATTTSLGFHRFDVAIRSSFSSSPRRPNAALGSQDPPRRGHRGRWSPTISCSSRTGIRAPTRARNLPVRTMSSVIPRNYVRYASALSPARASTSWLARSQSLWCFVPSASRIRRSSTGVNAAGTRLTAGAGSRPVTPM